MNHTMNEIVCLLDMVDYLKYIHIYFLYESLFFIGLLDVGSIHFDIVFGYVSHGLN